MSFIHIPHFEYLGIVNTRHIENVKLTLGHRTTNYPRVKWSWKKFKWVWWRGYWLKPHITIWFSNAYERVRFKTNKEAEAALKEILKEITKK